MEFDAEVLVGPGGGRRLPYETRELADGDVIDAGDVPMRVVTTPGPRPDHVAFIVGDGQVVLAGDLDGVRGARSIPGPGDDAAWAASKVATRSSRRRPPPDSEAIRHPVDVTIN